MEIAQLKYMLTLAKHLNFSRAANEVCVTPSSLSQQIKKLENELGVVLVERTTRSVHLTSAGVEFIESAEKIVAQISEINAIMQKYIAGESGKIFVGNCPFFEAYGMSTLIASFQKKYPDISLHFCEAGCLELYSLLCNDKIDVAFLPAFGAFKPEDEPSVEAYPLVDDELVIIVNSAHPLASRQIINLGEVSQEKFISFAKSYDVHQDTVEVCRLSGFIPQFSYETQYPDVVVRMVAEGMGIAMLSSRVLMRIFLKNIAVIRFKPTQLRTLTVAFLKKPNLLPAILNFKNFFIACTKGNRLYNPFNAGLARK
ncbi:LysR family transcriptional regulator|uniref:Transcriptional regulator, LysR family n=1 Tax=Dendrosporobacter quercicolus TaxID=146817 RepID=A0A1G9QHE6_9FIRM|nr:LysR family transcriptional regulator [Dendrosporobacter quercicolus]NSL48246.1 LysR family transcriptional regulator [Dendrosporobacter quercicolus DSM 1736]SDM10458.1 transcriptional regulator, LysR family [Dendrosporobacter quercicolus]